MEARIFFKLANYFFTGFYISMQVNFNNNHVNKNNFKGGGFYNSTAELEGNIVLSRALIDLAGCDVPWVIMANNKHERIERARRYVIVFLLAFMSPMALVPVLNRFAMKNIVKLTDKFWSNNHKALHLGNEFLTDVKKMNLGLAELARKTEMGPIEKFFYKVTGRKPAEQKLDLKKLIEKAGGEEELRDKLIKGKNWVLFLDFLSSGIPLGIMGFVNNYLTKKKTGQAGFSAELKMADKNIIEKRADSYEKNKYKRYAYFATLALGVSTLLPLAVSLGLRGKGGAKLNKFVQEHAKLINYKSGIYMSRLAFLALMVINHGGLLIASRNKTEAKDTLIRMGTGDAIFFGGDLLLGSIFANISDRLFNTKLRKDGQTSFFSKIFPKTKPIKTIIKWADYGIIPAKNKHVAVGLFWFNMAMLSVAMGFGIPTFINRLIKKDVKKDVDKNTQNPTYFMPNASKTFEKIKL